MQFIIGHPIAIIESISVFIFYMKCFLTCEAYGNTNEQAVAISSRFQRFYIFPDIELIYVWWNQWACKLINFQPWHLHSAGRLESDWAHSHQQHLSHCLYYVNAFGCFSLREISKGTSTIPSFEIGSFSWFFFSKSHYNHLHDLINKAQFYFVNEDDWHKHQIIFLLFAALLLLITPVQLEANRAPLFHTHTLKTCDPCGTPGLAILTLLYAWLVYVQLIQVKNYLLKIIQYLTLFSSIKEQNIYIIGFFNTSYLATTSPTELPKHLHVDIPIQPWISFKEADWPIISLPINSLRPSDAYMRL